MSSLSKESAPAGALDALRGFSLSHRTCGLPALGGVIAHGDAARLQTSLTSAGIESVVLSTCNRFEVYWRSPGAAADQTVHALLEATLPLAKELLHGGSTQLAGDDAARHLFRVCSGLESMVLGEAEILGQVRSAMEQAGGAGSFLRGVFTSAIRAGRGARAATGIATGAMSVASAAIQQLETKVRISEQRILLIGAGETAAKVARKLAKIGASGLVIANRTLDRAQALAETHRARAVTLDAIADEVATADVVICAANAASWMVTRAHVAHRHSASPLVIVDLSMPPAVEPFQIAGVTRIDLAEIERATAGHRQRREAEVPRVDAYIADELDWLRAWARQEVLRPFLSTLRQNGSVIDRDELERAREELKAGANPQEVLERLGRVVDRPLRASVDERTSTLRASEPS